MVEILLTRWSYLGIIVFLVLTGCGLPIPEEVPIVLAGVLSAHDAMNVWLALASCLIGALIGDCVMYSIGYHWGHNLLKDHPRFARFLHAEKEAYFESVIQNHGLKVMLLARFMVGIRSPVYLAAGIVRVPFRRFLLMDLLCATVVVSLFFSLAYFFGHTVIEYARRVEIGLTSVVVLAAIVAACWFYWRRRGKIVEKVVGTDAVDADVTETSELIRDREKTVA